MKKLLPMAIAMTLVLATTSACSGSIKQAANDAAINEPPVEISIDSKGDPDWESNPGYSPDANEPLKRAANWRKIVDTPVIGKQDLAMIDGSTATIPITAEIMRQFFGYSDKKIAESSVVEHSKTAQAYYYLTHKTAKLDDGSKKPISLLFVTAPSASELDDAKKAGVKLDAKPIASDGFVFIVNKDNPVESLTLEQIRGIYSGVITNWSEVGGADVPIKAFQRNEGSGSQTAMEQLVMKNTPILPAPKIEMQGGMSGLIRSVAEYQNSGSSIGYTYKYYIDNLYKNENIKVLKINGVAADADNLVNKSYPLTTNYYAVIRADEKAHSPARKLQDFLLTKTGQELIEMAGYQKAA